MMEDTKYEATKNLEELYNESRIVGTLKSMRIGWAAHVWKLEGLNGQVAA